MLTYSLVGALWLLFFLVMALSLACCLVWAVSVVALAIRATTRRKWVGRHLRFLSLFLLLGALSLGMTCNQNQQTKTYDTLFSLEKGVTGAYDGYLQAVLAGQVRTNEVPRVSHEFNSFQKAMALAAEADSTTNALAPAALLAEGTDLISLIASLKGGK